MTAHALKQESTARIAAALASFGYSVYLAERGTHGFYTDGKRVVSFQTEYIGMTSFSGNYRTDIPRQTGTGWGFADGRELNEITEQKARAFITANAPDWAVRGAKSVAYTTPEQHLALYGPSSRYTVVGYTGKGESK